MGSPATGNVRFALVSFLMRTVPLSPQLLEKGTFFAMLCGARTLCTVLLLIDRHVTSARGASRLH
jgi:hypothetical protein